MATETFSKFFGGIVRVHRTQKALTQETLAERAGVHSTYIGMVERGERNCSLDIAFAIAQALDTSFADLVKKAESECARHSRRSSRKGQVS